MILSVSGRTDIVAFYTKWFMNRFHEGFVDVRNPFNPRLISRIYFDNVDLIFFCTKNPLPIIPYLQEFNKPIMFHVTLTSYKNDIEPGVIPKGKIINGIKKISSIIGKDNVVVRYDPVFISDVYNVEYHKRNFEKLCKLLNGYINKIIVSFIDDYKNVRNNLKEIKYKPFNEDIYREIGISFSESAKKYNITVQTCFEEINLTEYGFIKGECLSKELAYKLTGKEFKEEWKARKEAKCHCVKIIDIGAYNSCAHFCKYCYANFNEKIVNDNVRKHDENSSLLIGKIDEYDIIKEKNK